MPHRLRAAALAVSLSLGLTGCDDTLCGLGFGECAPCEATDVPESWAQPHLEALVPGGDAIVCSTSGEDTSKATLSYWVPERVHPANAAAVTAAQGLGWARVEDNWFDASDTSQMAKRSNLELARGDTLHIEVEAGKRGSQVVLTVEGAPPPPELRGDVTVFAYGAGVFSLYDGHLSLLPGVSGGVSIPLEDGFYFRLAAGHYGQYRADGTATVFPEFPADTTEGFLSAHGPGPRGAPWVSYSPKSPGKAVLLGELVDGAWDLHVVPDDPPLPRGKHRRCAHPRRHRLAVGGQDCLRPSLGSVASPEAARRHGLRLPDSCSCSRSPDEPRPNPRRADLPARWSRTSAPRLFITRAREYAQTSLQSRRRNTRTPSRQPALSAGHSPCPRRYSPGNSNSTTGTSSGKPKTGAWMETPWRSRRRRRGACPATATSSRCAPASNVSSDPGWCEPAMANRPGRSTSGCC